MKVNINKPLLDSRFTNSGLLLWALQKHIPFFSKLLIIIEW